MKAYRYNWDLDDVAEINIKDDWNCPLQPKSFEVAINCANCGKPITYGKSFSSLEIETADGLGYWVCGPCHEREIKRRANSLRYQKYRRTVL